MFRFVILSICILGLYGQSGCTTRTVPITGRQQLTLAQDDALNKQAAHLYSETLRAKGLSSRPEERRMVREVGEKIQKAVELYYRETGRSAELSLYQWEFNVVNDPAINAFCFPGGKVVFNSGIIPVCGSEVGIAFVMGHEIAHAIAHHTNEYQTQKIIADTGIAVASISTTEEYQRTLNDLAKLSVELGLMLPHNRRQELEADHIGLILMAMAGYDPYESVEYFNRMESKAVGSTGLPWLATHPLDAVRIKHLEIIIPNVLPIYKKALLEGR
jgi:predicted Zn-dependent protease